jgi:uncharacterized membrane protein HdeD (DUF308 family)
MAAFGVFWLLLGVLLVLIAVGSSRRYRFSRWPFLLFLVVSGILVLFFTLAIVYSLVQTLRERP